MKFNREYILKEKTLPSDAQTYIQELPESGVISRLDVKFAATNGATSNRGNTIQQVVSKIEIIANGSEVLYSATGQEIVRLAWLHSKKYPSSNLDERGGEVQYMTFPIMFGRFLGDEEYGLDLARFTSVDIRITYDLEAVRATGATGFVSGSTVLSIIAYRAPKGQAVAPDKYIRTTEIKTFTSAASGVEIVELPIKYKYRGIGVYCYEAGVADNVDIISVKLDLNKGERILFTSEWDHLQEENAKMYDINPQVKIVSFSSNDDTLETWTGTCLEVQVHSRQTADIAGDVFYHAKVDSISGGVLTFDCVAVDVTAGAEDLTSDTTDRVIDILAKGIGVGNFVYIPTSLKADLTDALDSTQYDQIDLHLEQGGAGATVGVVLEEIATY